MLCWPILAAATAASSCRKVFMAPPYTYQRRPPDHLEINNFTTHTTHSPALKTRLHKIIDWISSSSDSPREQLAHHDFITDFFACRYLRSAADDDGVN